MRFWIAGSNDLVVYQSEFLASLRAASNAMERTLTEDFGVQERKRTHYAAIDEERVKLSCDYTASVHGPEEGLSRWPYVHLLECSRQRRQ